MFPRVISVVFIFMLPMRFPSNLLINEGIKNHYGSNIVKLVRRIEKRDFKYRKTLLDLDFLENLLKNELKQNFCTVVWQIKISEILQPTESRNKDC